MLVFTGLAGIAAAASAVVAIVQAVKAGNAESRAIAAQSAAEAARDESAAMAAKATAAFIRQAEALEQSNRLKEEEMKPPTWSKKHVRDQLYAMVNTSMRTVFVERIEVAPEGTAGRVRFTLAEDGLYEPGDRIEYINGRIMGRNAHKFTAFWRFADEPESALSELIVSL